jgi:dienelactone hydrolase
VSANQRAGWQQDAARYGLSLDLLTYPGGGHFFTDDTIHDYDADAADKTWARAARFLEDVSR